MKPLFSKTFIQHVMASIMVSFCVFFLSPWSVGRSRGPAVGILGSEAWLLWWRSEHRSEQLVLPLWKPAQTNRYTASYMRAASSTNSIHLSILSSSAHCKAWSLKSQSAAYQLKKCLVFPLQRHIIINFWVTQLMTYSWEPPEVRHNRFDENKLQSNNWTGT